jgi:hypothetical protein
MSADAVTGPVRRMATATVGALLLLALPFTVSTDPPHY